MQGGAGWMGGAEYIKNLAQLAPAAAERENAGTHATSRSSPGIRWMKAWRTSSGARTADH